MGKFDPDYRDLTSTLVRSHSASSPPAHTKRKQILSFNYRAGRKNRGMATRGLILWDQLLLDQVNRGC